MKKWEYKLINADSSPESRWENDLEKTINKLGADGWEAVGIITRGSSNSSTYVVLKREKTP